MSKEKPGLPKGTRDFGPEEMIRRTYIFDTIKEVFKKYGYVKNVKILKEGKLNKSKGVAFVDMVALEDAQKAITELNGSLYKGRTLKVSLAKTQDFKKSRIKNRTDNFLPKKLKITKDNIIDEMTATYQSSEEENQ